MKTLSLLKSSTMLLCSLILVGCTQEELDLKQTVQKQDYTFKISPEEAIWRASAMVEKLDGSQTRMGRRTVKDIKLLGSLSADGKTTRSNDGMDSLFYLINFEDEQGFALMSADRRALPVYAFSETGSLTEQDMERDALKPIMTGITIDAISRINVWVDTTIVRPNPNFPGPGFYEPTSWTVGPQLKGNQARLHYKAPFNKYCRTSSGEPANSGCVPVAAAAIMWYYKWPNSYGDYTFDWDNPEADDFDTLAKLLEALGRVENFRVSYKVSDKPMSASPGNLPRTFENFGYAVPNKDTLSFFKTEYLIVDILKTAPIYMVGDMYVPKDDGTLHREGSHAWVIDGYFAYYDDYPHNETIPYQRMYHCVWGWGGDSNGYYYVADEKAFVGLADIPDSDNPEDNHDTRYVNYNYYIRYYYGMSPNK